MPDYVSWPGLGGRTYSFQLYPIGTSFKKIAGIYVFCKSAGNGYWHAIYVGETGDLDERLNTRLQGHQAWPSARFYGATHVCVMPLGAEIGTAARMALETELRHSLRPPANRQSA